MTQRMLGPTVLLVLLATPARAQEFEPEEGVFAGHSGPEPYELLLRQALIGEDHYRFCQMVVLPSFHEERAVFMTYDQKAHIATVVSRTLKQQVWSRMMAEMSKGRREYRLDVASEAAALKKISAAVVTRTARLDEETGRQLILLCNHTLRRVRYPAKDRLGVDGTIYHVATWAGPFLAGHAWSPDEGTLPADFVAMEESLQTIAEAKDDAARAKAKAELTARAQLVAKHLETPPTVH